MENPINTVTKTVSVNSVLKWLILALVGFLLLDLAGLTQWVIQPFTTFKAWNARRKASA